MNVFPDWSGMPGIGTLAEVIGALLMFVLVVAVLMLIISAITWAIATSNGNPQLAQKARAGLLVACLATILAGASSALTNWLLSIGQHL